MTTTTTNDSPIGWAVQMAYDKGFLAGYLRGSKDMRKAHGSTLGTPRQEASIEGEGTEDERGTQRVRDAESGVAPLTPPGNRWVGREPYSSGRAICLHDGAEDASYCPNAESDAAPQRLVIARFPPDYR